ncbi:hypothetical protein BGX28_000384 [Mortierella sp. GBA30]|nr:hypothetical protein BGX28_000384 [Mortierella sp. GBA30]
MASGKDSLDLDEDLLDYGDSYDLDANDELLAEDLANVEGADEFDLGVEDDFPLDAFEETGHGVNNNEGAHNSAGSHDPNQANRVNEHGKDTSEPTADYRDKGRKHDGQDEQTSKQDQQQQHQNNNGGQYQREGSPGGYNQQISNGRQPYSNPSWRGRGGSGMRGRGHQNYMGMGRGNFQGGLGMNPYSMMGMGMNPVIAQDMMNMMNMGMGMSHLRYPSTGYGIQGMVNTYGGAGVDDNRMNPAMVASPGRTIHINPKFQNRAGVPPVIPAGVGLDQQKPQLPQNSLQQRSQYQDGSRGQSVSWNRNGKDDVSSDRSGHDRADPYRSSSRSDREDGTGQSNKGSSERRSSEMGYSSSSDSSRRSTRPRSRSPPSRSGGSITSRLSQGSKRYGDEQEGLHKAQKTNGGSTPRSDYSRTEASGSDMDRSSVSFLREKREHSDSGSISTAPKGFVKMENVPQSVSDASIRKLADGVSGVNRILTIDKKEDRIVMLGFASVDEAKFFRRQINRFDSRILLYDIVAITYCLRSLH